MKKYFAVLCLLLWAVPLWADDDLTPEPQDQEIKEYLEFAKTDKPDPMNHVVWKLYVFSQLVPNAGLNRSTQAILAGLLPTNKKNYFVIVGLNQLWNFLSSSPKTGDVIVVEGRIVVHTKTHMWNDKAYHVLKNLYLYPSNAKLLPGAHFELPVESGNGTSVSPSSQTITPAALPVQPVPATAGTILPVVTVNPVNQNQPYIPDKGQR